MVRLREHIDGREFKQFISFPEQCHVARLRRGIAADIGDAFRGEPEDFADHLRVHAAARRVDDKGSG